MAANSPMEGTPHLATTSDLEIRAARIADPNIDLKTKHAVAAEIREMLDTVRDIESVRALPLLVPALLELLRSGEPAFLKDSVEFQFRRLLLEIISRLPVNDAIRPQITPIFNTMLHILRHDNEDNGIAACKTLLDLIRNYKSLTEDSLSEFVAIFQEAHRNMKPLVEQVLSENSALLEANVALPSIRSFKVLGEMAMVMVIMSQAYRPSNFPVVQSTIAPSFEMLALESPAQRKAKDDYEAMGGIWAGMAPTIVNMGAYSDFIHSQIKILSYLAYVMRYSGESEESYGDTLIVSALRMLQDCPANGIPLRKELMVVFRHLMGTPHRKALIGHLNKLFDENVLLGSSVSSKETLRAAVYTAVADLVHNIRVELSAEQLSRIVHVYSRILHNPALGNNLHTLSAKMIFGLADCIIVKETPAGAARLFMSMFEMCLERLEALAIVYGDLAGSTGREKGLNTNLAETSIIEKARPVGGAIYAQEKPEDVIHESRMVYRTLLHGCRVCLASLKRCDASAPEGDLIFRLFDAAVRCMPLFDPEPKPGEQNDIVYESFSSVLMELHPHVLQEVWTHKMEFFFQFASKRISLMNVCQALFTRESTSSILLAIVLDFLVERLPLLGEYDDMTAAATIRLFKLAFAAVAAYPPANEPILAHHLAKLLMDCFPLAAKATKPTNYFFLLRALFRAIGGGGGKFELLYQEVLPLLPEMLESLNRQLMASEGHTRDMIVELCLTVPLRLTHLLPHLTYLMQPLALALRGNPELVSQGLRTLELCIDNLTPDFLDPTLSTVLRELMEALHSHLKPLPANHHPAHTTIRILGKLGGRNRRLLNKEPFLQYRHHSEPAQLSISFGGSLERIELAAVSSLAVRTLLKGTPADRAHAYAFLENSMSAMVHEGIQGRNIEENFSLLLEGLFDALYIPAFAPQAETFIRQLAQATFDFEIRRGQSRTPGSRHSPSPLLSCYLETIPHALTRDQSDHSTKGQEAVSHVVNDLVAMNQQPNITIQDLMPILHQIANRFTALCLGDSWAHKKAGASGIRIMTGTPVLGIRWISDREVDLVRTLLHILKDLPKDLPRDVDDIIDVITSVLKMSNSNLDFQAEGSTTARNKIVHLAGIFFPELQSSNSIVRRAAQTSLDVLVSLSGRPATELLMPHRDRMLASIYTKPLRALPFPKQIGMIEAIRYCISLDPPFVELNDELLRLLHEALALADADDAALLGRVMVRQNLLEVTKLRVACIKLLTASMPLTDFFQKQHQTRQRVTSVYFKSLYSSSTEVKDVAHEGLRMVLTHQSRLPKELLQTGLRPILMNLADPKRLSVPGLEGLARLLELLTNYFKVEIGHKLLDHFRIVADPQLLSDTTKNPLSSAENITKLVRLANIFHLLPSAANIFLENFVNAIVQTESQLHFSTKSPFSEPLAKYLDRYPVEGIDFFIQNMGFPRHLRTLRSILRARLAPNLERELTSRTPYIVAQFLQHKENKENNQIAPTLLLFRDMAQSLRYWLTENKCVLDALVDIWRSEPAQPEQAATVMPEVIERHNLILDIFMEALSQSSRIDLLFEIVSIFTRGLAMDIVHVIRFLYHHVAFRTDTIFRRNVLMRFLPWFDDPSISWSQKASFIRYIVTPTLLVHASRKTTDGKLISRDFVSAINTSIWSKFSESGPFSGTDDMFKIEILHLTTVMVHHYSDLLEDARKEIIKGAWFHITNSDDMIVKQTAYLLAARFFAAYATPPKMVLRAWTGLLRSPHSEGKPHVRQEALATLAPSLPRSDTGEVGHPQWAKTTRRLLAEEGVAQMIAIYHLIIKQPSLFYPVRSLFIPHMANSLNKLGMSASSNFETRLLSIDILQVIFNWEEQANEELRSSNSIPNDSVWLTPLGFRENMVSYLVRLATMHHDQPARVTLLPRALSLLQMLVGPNGWTDVTVGLRFFSRALEQNELNSETAIGQALAAAKVLHVITKEQSDSWYSNNAAILQKLVQKGLTSEDYGLQDALHPIFDHLLRLYPLPKEDEDSKGEHSEFHTFVYSAINEGLRNSTSLRGILLMLKSVVRAVPERIEAFVAGLMKLMSKLAKDHVQASANSSAGHENSVRLLVATLDIFQSSMSFLGEHRRYLLSTLVVLAEKSRNAYLCRYMLDLAKSWCQPRQEVYPTMKEKANFLQKMASYEGRHDALYQSYLELIYEIYTDPSLRRSDLTVRLEHSFLLGCRAKDPSLRERFIDLLDSSIPRSLFNRLTYILGVQSWDALADQNWICLALHLVLGAADIDVVMSHDRWPGSSIIRPKTQSVVRPIQRLLFLDPQVAHKMWLSLFPAAWNCLTRREQSDITHHMINLLAKEYHIRQAHMRPNVIQTLLAGIHACSPPMILPPHLIKYLAKTFGAWYTALEILGTSLENMKEDEPLIRDYVYDSLADVYAELAEEDMFYGLWRRRCLHLETNVALSLEQNGLWEQALAAYEAAQNKSRAGTIAFSEAEYCLWEDHWILAAEKLQHWDLLYDLAKSEGNYELMLESAWRTKEWAENKEVLEEQISQLPEVPTPRRRVFEAFIALLKTPAALDKNVEFTKILEDAMQLSLRKWVGLPPHLSAAHVPLLQHFQQFVELQEAVQIFGSLSQTNAQNLEKKSSELKMVLQAWRERLPNIHDDISIWSDLVAWRQNVFHSINKAYIPIINGTGQGANAAANNTNTYGYRGYHETAWIINRFAHVARKHDLLDVCFTYLTKIYTLPNIEISEAFLKLREQARCHYQKPNDLQAGLEVINNTNLMFFSNSQKAEFYTLKGMFHARFGRNEEANIAFGQAVQLDMVQAKAWAEWGRFNDRMFKESPQDLSHAANAVSCYLQAAGQYKNSKSRPLLARILWLLSLDDNQFAISRAFDTYKGDAAFWFWIPLIPQLCFSISHREVKQARYVLLNLARLYPQALFYQLRTTREELQISKKAAEKAAAVRPTGVQVPSQIPRQPTDQSMGTTQNNTTQSNAPNGDSTNAATFQAQGSQNIENSHADRSANPSQPGVAHSAVGDAAVQQRQPWEYIDEVLQVLKTSFPLLILSLETLIDQIQHKFKLSPDEDIYRNICMLLQEAIQNYVLRMNAPDDEGLLSEHTITTLQRMGQNMPIQAKKEYEEDFLKNKPTHQEYIQKLQQWRDKYENLLDARPRLQPLAVLSHYLTEFQYSKVDEIEVPGQYTEDKDSNQNFVKIQKFAPKFENCRSNGTCWKRFTLHGHDNSKTAFVVQLPCHRQYRREDRVMQVLRAFNGALNRKKESRKRNLMFHVPPAVSCSPNLRLFQTDSSYISLIDIYDLHCEENGFSKEEPILYAGEKVKKVLQEFRQSSARQLTKTEYITLKKEVFDEVAAKMVPETILTRYMIRIMDGPSELWRMRKQFSLQIASSCFMTYVFCLSSRNPSRFHVSRATGLIAMSELLPGFSNQVPIFATSEIVPFRLTPNMQNFMGPIFTEAILTSSIMAIGRCLTEPEFDLEQQLCLFSRDEVTTWMRGRPWTADLAYRQNVAANIDGIVKRAETMACKTEREQSSQSGNVAVPVVQTVTNLISSATNPVQLAKMGELYQPWF